MQNTANVNVFNTCALTCALSKAFPCRMKVPMEVRDNYGLTGRLSNERYVSCVLNLSCRGLPCCTHVTCLWDFSLSQTLRAARNALHYLKSSQPLRLHGAWSSLLLQAPASTKTSPSSNCWLLRYGCGPKPDRPVDLPGRSLAPSIDPMAHPHLTLHPGIDFREPRPHATHVHVDLRPGSGTRIVPSTSHQSRRHCANFTASFSTQHISTCFVFVDHWVLVQVHASPGLELSECRS